MSLLKRLLYKILPLDNYLRLMQRGYFFAYNLGMLRSKPEYAYHYYVEKLITEGDTVIDIGANLGYYSILFAGWTGPEGKVFSVEPLKVYNKIFNEIAKYHPNITLYPYALGEEEKDVEMVSSSHGGYFRTGLPHVYDAARDGSPEKQEFKFTARMVQASKLFEGLEKIDYIKCDIEGFEYVVLSDMKELIAKHRPKLQIEVWEENEEKILDLFAHLNYKAYKLHQNQLVPYDKNTPAIAGDFIFLPE